MLLKKEGLGDPQAFVVGMEWAISTDQSKDAVTKLCQQGLEVDPGYLPLVSRYGKYITPCQMGFHGEAAQFALQSAAKTINEDQALRIYAAVGAVIGCQGEPTDFGANGFDMPKLARVQNYWRTNFLTRPFMLILLAC